MCSLSLFLLWIVNNSSNSSSFTQSPLSCWCWNICNSSGCTSGSGNQPISKTYDSNELLWFPGHSSHVCDHCSILQIVSFIKVFENLGHHTVCLKWPLLFLLSMLHLWNWAGSAIVIYYNLHISQCFNTTFRCNWQYWTSLAEAFI